MWVIVITKRDICIYAYNKGCGNHQSNTDLTAWHQSCTVRSCTPKLYSYRRKCRLKYLEHVVKEDKSPQQQHRMAAEQLTVATARKRIFTSILNNVVTFRQRKRRKLARKRIHNTADAHVQAVCMNTLTSMADLTRLVVTGPRTCVDWRQTEVMTPVRSVCLDVLLLLE